MKTIQDVHKLIAGIESRVKNKDFKNKREENALKKRIPHLRHCIQYLESNPTEEFVSKQLTDVEEKINRRMILFTFPEDCDKRTISRLRKDHEKKWEVPNLREQMRTLRFLLSK